MHEWCGLCVACLTIKKFAANELRERNFHSACNFGIIRLNDKILPKSEQNLKFLKRITEHIFGKR
ncbi:hypothetical protein ATCC51562_1139 [Campylobacter concisus ATCC 51562]|uniref:Uncharacterized protein n=1 Tax=Campylobacter concisus ATCC 51562 TaxID=1242969 RepID=U2ES81_9BACT|nr:hypothetical protein ATCC51562_1139 [Campylobacter concisus ATCC 51562]